MGFKLINVFYKGFAVDISFGAWGSGVSIRLPPNYSAKIGTKDTAAGIVTTKSSGNTLVPGVNEVAVIIFFSLNGIDIGLVFTG